MPPEEVAAPSLPSAPAAAPPSTPAATPDAAPSKAAGVEHLETSRTPVVRSQTDRIAAAAAKLDSLSVTPPNAEPLETPAAPTFTPDPEPVAPQEPAAIEAERQAKIAETVAARREAHQHQAARAQAETALEQERQAHAQTRTQLEARAKHVDPAIAAAKWAADPLGLLEDLGITDVLPGYQKLTAHAANPTQRQLEQLKHKQHEYETAEQTRQREAVEAAAAKDKSEREAVEQRAFTQLYERVTTTTGDEAKFPFLSTIEAADRFKRADDLARAKNAAGQQFTEESIFAELETAEKARFEKRATALGLARPPAPAATPAAPKTPAPKSIGADMAGQSAGRTVVRSRDERIAAAARAITTPNNN